MIFINTKTKKKTDARIFTAMAVVLLTLFLFVVSVYAADKRVVKVAFFPMDGYHITRADGKPDGMDVAYLKAICAYTGWEVEYVECDSWDQALKLLKNKKVDLVGSAQYSAERAAEFEYADLASGYTFGVIATNGGSTIAYEDFEKMQGITFGMVKKYVRRDEFIQYLADNGISDPIIKEYDTTEILQQALADGEVDALVHTFTEIQEGQRLIGRFAPRPFYYITYQGNTDVLRELNQAIADLKINQPELEASLMNTYYYNKFDKSALLTTEEKTYLAETPAFVVGYLDGHYPLSYVEEDQFRGLSMEMMSGFAIVGPRIKYVQLRDEWDARAALQDGTIDILLYCTDPQDILTRYGLMEAQEYAKVPLALVMEKSGNAEDVRVLATVSYLREEAEEQLSMDNVQIRIYSTQEACLEALKNGSADAVLCDGYLAEHLFRTDSKYEKLHIRSIISSGYPVCIAVRQEDSILASILAKTISPIDSQAINEYMLKENTYPLVNLRVFIQDHSMAIILILIVILVGVVLVARHIINDEKRIRSLMYKDTFMDIWNLNYLIYWGEHKLLTDSKRNYAVVYLNLTQFRHYNIIYGWSAGERILESIAVLLQQKVQPDTEICARNQGDLFALLLCYNTREELMERLETLRVEVETHIYEKTENRMPLKMGVYFVPQQAKNLQTALNYASQALDYTENNDENAIKVYDEKLEQTIKANHEREKLLESVDVNKDFTVYYQPKVDIGSGKIVGAEALVRFLNPAENGAVKAPGFFVPYFEQTGRITEIDLFVYESVCKMLRKRLDAGENVVTISCNFSRMHFIKPGFTERFEAILEKYHVDKELIEVEITETLVIEELQQNIVMQTLDTMRQKGIHLSIDDFGAGYSSLGIFEQIPASVVKLDRSFLLNQQNHERQVAIMRGIVNLANALDAQIVCEGVETDADIQLMQEIGANVAQGYYYSKPIPQKEFEEKLNQGGYGPQYNN